MARSNRAICIRANMMSIKFCYCPSEIKSLRFKSYCGNIYCRHLWADYSEYHSVKMVVLYNNVFRILFRFDKYCSASAMFGNLRTPYYGKIMMSIIYRFICRICSSSNILNNSLLPLCHRYGFVGNLS